MMNIHICNMHILSCVSISLSPIVGLGFLKETKTGTNKKSNILFCTGVVVINEVVSRVLEVIEHVLLVAKHATLVPGLTVFTGRMDGEKKHRES